MSRRLRKQLAYGALYLAILIFVGSGTYFRFIREEPSCRNERQDEGELGLDCGGVCAKICLPSDFHELSADNPKFFTPTEGKGVVLVQIRNSNPKIAARDFGYKLRLVDAKNKEFKSFEGKSFAYAGEAKYLYEFFDIPEGTTVKRGEISISGADWVAEESFRRPAISISERTASKENGNIKLSGTIASSDTVTFLGVSILGLFKDAGGKIQSVSATELDKLSPGESRSFSIFHPELKDLDPGRTELVVLTRRP